MCQDMRGQLQQFNSDVAWIFGRHGPLDLDYLYTHLLSLIMLLMFQVDSDYCKGANKIGRLTRYEVLRDSSTV